jgi:hypothetical protein
MAKSIVPTAPTNTANAVLYFDTSTFYDLIMFWFVAYNTACGSGMFRCSSSQCIDVKLRCNNEVDCIDGSDELRCTSVNDKKRQV